MATGLLGCYVTVVPKNLTGLRCLRDYYLIAEEGLINFTDDKGFARIISLTITFSQILFLFFVSLLLTNEVFQGSVLAFLTLESNESSDWSLQFSALFFNQFINFFVNFWNFIKLSSRDQSASLS